MECDSTMRFTSEGAVCSCCASQVAPPAHTLNGSMQPIIAPIVAHDMLLPEDRHAEALGLLGLGQWAALSASAGRCL